MKGLGLTWKHLFNARFTRGAMNVEDAAYFQQERGHVTLQYPHETISVPDNGRYQLACEIDDCIVCDKCAKVCPVDCIEIEAIKSPDLIRTTSDGSPVRLHAAKFDIDMAKCCFCGLCTTVCPTECLTMESEYDFSVWDVNEMNFAFATLTPAQAEEKRQLYNQFVAEKEAAKKAPAPADSITAKPPVGFKPTMKAPTIAKPAFKPTAKPPENSEQIIKASNNTAEAKPPVGFKPTTKAPTTAKPAFKPTAKPPVISPKSDDEQTVAPISPPVKPSGFRPTIKPPKKQEND